MYFVDLWQIINVVETMVVSTCVQQNIYACYNILSEIAIRVEQILPKSESFLGQNVDFETNFNFC